MWAIVNPDGVLIQVFSVEPTTRPPNQVVNISTDPLANAASVYPERFEWNGSALQLRPTWTISYDATTESLTATLTHASSAPASGTLTVLATPFVLPISGGVMTLPIIIDETASVFTIPVTAHASGTFLATSTIGGTMTPPSPLQIYTPSGSSAVTVGPTSSDWVMGFYAGQLSAAQTTNAMTVAVGWMLHFMHDTLIPWMQQTTYAPLSMTDNQKNAQSIINTNVAANIPFTLENLIPSGGAAQPVFVQLANTMTSVSTLLTAANDALARIPNLH